MTMTTDPAALDAMPTLVTLLSLTPGQRVADDTHPFVTFVSRLADRRGRCSDVSCTRLHYVTTWATPAGRTFTETGWHHGDAVTPV
jgi:hypothetical protein